MFSPFHESDQNTLPCKAHILDWTESNPLLTGYEPIRVHVNSVCSKDLMIARCLLPNTDQNTVQTQTTFSGTLTSGTGIPVVKPELIDFAWSCLISFDRVQAARGRPRRSSISAIAGPDRYRQLSVRSDAATFDGDQCSFRLSLAFLFAFAVSILAFADVQIFSAALVLLFLRSLFLQRHRMLHCTPLGERWRALRRELSQRSSRTKSG